MDENDEYDVSTEHDHLVSAITKLDKTQHISEPTRNEPTNLNSEFNLIKRSNKLDLSKVVNVLKDTAQHAKITKRLKNTQDKSNVLAKPLEKPQAERIKRSTGYDITKEKVGKWDPVVARNRTVDFVSFPLKSASTKRENPTKVILSNLKLKSPLERELEEIDPPIEAEEEMEEDQSFPMTYEEMLEHRQQLAKLRAQQSYKAAKAKRQSKIKSKKYHRILKKERLKQQLKEFEELQTKNPEEALKKLEELEKARAVERHTLRHKNTGKWAKSKLVRAKYDKEVRQELAEQLAVSRGLTQKTQDTASTDDEPDDEVVPDITLAQDPMNPWMMKRPNKSNVDAEFDFGYKKYLNDKIYKRKDESDSDDENTVEQIESSDLSALKDNILKLGNRAKEELDVSPIQKEESVDDDVKDSNKNSLLQDEKCILDTIPSKKTTKHNISGKFSKQTKKVVSTSNWVVEDINSNSNKKTDVSEVFEKLESKIAIQVDKKLEKLKQQIKQLEKTPKSEKIVRKNKTDKDNLESLKFKKRNPRPIIDEELIETNERDAENVSQVNKTPKLIKQSTETQPETKTNSDIDPSRFIEVKPKYLNTALSQGENDLDNLDDNDEQIVPKVDIEEVFEEDDVVASFRQEKQDEIDNDKPKEIDLHLPGWGSWGGKGVKAPKRKRNRFISKPIPKMPRRDENKGDIIINELKIPQLAAHKVSELPFPFTRVSDYEASIRAPIGNTFIPETAHKKLIKPSVITKAGTIIEPMDEEQLLVKRNLTFNNQGVIKLLAKK